MHIFKNTNFDFLKWRWHAIILSWVIILAGVAAIWTKGIPMGVEFAGGTVIIPQFEQAVSVEQVRTALDKSFRGGDIVVQQYGDPAQNQVIDARGNNPANGAACLSRRARHCSRHRRSRLNRRP